MLKPKLQLTQQPKPEPKPAPKPSRRRPSDTFLQTLSTKEGAELLAKELESNPLFQNLLAQGLIRKVRWQGRFFHYGFLTTQGEPHEPPSPPYVGDFSDIVEIASRFVHRHNLSQKDFETYVLSGDYNAQQIAERFGCSLEEADTLLNAIIQLEIIETFSELTAPPTGSVSPPSDHETVVAEVVLDGKGQIQLLWHTQRLNTRYRIDHEHLQVWLKMQGDSPELRAILQKVLALNEYAGAMNAIVHTVCVAQREFLLSGDPQDLRPLPQAEVARLTGYHRSVVSRLIRGQLIQTPHGRYRLQSLMPTRKAVIQRLIQTHPEWSDSQIATYLQQRFGGRLSRRAVNYHRQSSAGTK